MFLGGRELQNITLGQYNTTKVLRVSSDISSLCSEMAKLRFS